MKSIVMTRDNFTCQCCGSTDKTLQVHHKKYTGAPWEAKLDDLVTLCYECHNTIHFIGRMIQQSKGSVDITVAYYPTHRAFVVKSSTNTNDTDGWYELNYESIERSICEHGLKLVYQFETFHHKEWLVSPVITMFIGKDISEESVRDDYLAVGDIPPENVMFYEGSYGDRVFEPALYHELRRRSSDIFTVIEV